MYFFHSGEIWKEFPQLVPGLMYVTGITPTRHPGPRLHFWLQKAKDRLAEAQESRFPEVVAWRNVYSRMGLKPSKYRSAAEALLRRVRKTGDLPRLHPLVDMCNAVSVAFAIPVAVLDIDRVAGSLEVCKATGSEEYLAFSGEVEHPHKGEVIFRDENNHAHARRWTFRQSRLSTVSESTSRAMIISEGMHESALEDVPTLLNVLRQELLALGFDCSEPMVLTAQDPRFIIEPQNIE